MAERKYLDLTGLGQFWAKVKAAYVAADEVVLNSAKGYADGLKSELDGTIEALDGRVGVNEGNISGLQSAVQTLNGAATVEGSVAHTVAAEIAKVVAGAPEDFDTLKEVADWIASDTTGAAAMQANISTLRGEMDVLKGADTVEGSVAKSVKDAVDAEALLRSNADSALDGRIAALESAVGGEGEGEGESLSERMTQAESDIDVLEAAMGDLTAGSVASRIATAKSELVNGASAGYQTLKETEDKIKAEASRAAGVEEGLQGSINTLNAAVGSLEAGSVDSRIATAKSELVNGASAGYQTLKDIEGKIGALNTKDAEIEAAYKAADATLKSEVEAGYAAADATLKSEITTAYGAADAALKSELETAYKAADTALSGRIEVLEGKDVVLHSELVAITEAEIAEIVK